jgi:hypothetical protein
MNKREKLINWYRHLGTEEFYEVGQSRPPKNDPELAEAYLEGYRLADRNETDAAYEHALAMEKIHDRTR